MDAHKNLILVFSWFTLGKDNFAKLSRRTKGHRELKG
jgi:hypothetical protein